jgi:hypothetical protein
LGHAFALRGFGDHGAVPEPYWSPPAVSACYDMSYILVTRGSMPRRRVPLSETKAQKFQRLANLRTNLILDDLRKIGGLSNRNHYEYSEEEVNTIFDTIEKAVTDTKGRFLGRTRREFRL